MSMMAQMMLAYEMQKEAVTETLAEAYVQWLSMWGMK